jgi:outer membrane immunogenic protein
MHRSILATLASAAIGLSAMAAASAADLPARGPIYKAPAAVPAFSWTGCYVGAQGGYAWGRSGYDLGTPGVAGTGTTFDANGGVAGGHVGCNYQINQFVLGIEGDGEWTNLTGSDGGFGGTIDQIDGRWQASIRGRAGYAFGTTMIYATGGAAWLNVDYSRPNFDGNVINSTLNGWTVGGGVEHYFAPQWSVRAEYRYARFDSQGFPFTTGTPRTLNVTDTSTVRAGVSYKFW